LDLGCGSQHADSWQRGGRRTPAPARASGAAGRPGERRERGRKRKLGER